LKDYGDVPMDDMAGEKLVP